jgi:hypothetical protein
VALLRRVGVALVNSAREVEACLRIEAEPFVPMVSAGREGAVVWVDGWVGVVQREGERWGEVEMRGWNEGEIALAVPEGVRLATRHKCGFWQQPFHLIHPS